MTRTVWLRPWNPSWRLPELSFKGPSWLPLNCAVGVTRRGQLFDSRSNHHWMRIGRKFVLSVIFGLLGAVPSVLATDVAILRNGFSIRHERRSILGVDSRLHLTDHRTRL